MSDLAGVKTFNNVCHQSVLDVLLEIAQGKQSWHYRFPTNAPFKDKHPKMDIISSGTIRDEFLSGIALSILIQIWELNDRKQFIPEIFYCGISIKDKHFENNVHIDDADRNDTIKIMGILNKDRQTTKQTQEASITHTQSRSITARNNNNQQAMHPQYIYINQTFMFLVKY